jgi:hypothetical protein
MNLKKFAKEHGVVTYEERQGDIVGHVGWYLEYDPSSPVLGCSSHHAARKDWLVWEYGEIKAKALMESWKKPTIKTKSSLKKSSTEKRLERENKKLLAENERMAEWVKDAGLRYDVCTKTILKEVCSNCTCR